MIDVIIIGSGPAGISASLYLKRANKKILIISKKDGALENAEKIENYYGVMPISGKELYDIGIKQATFLGVEFFEDEVLSIEQTEEGFRTTTLNTEFLSKKVILATGASRKVPNIKGIEDFNGKGISYCAICDGYFFKNKDVAVVGSGNYALHEAKQLQDICSSVVILTNSEKLVENRGEEIPFEIEENKIREFRGNNKIEEIEFENNSKRKISGVFIAVGTATSSDLAKKIGVIVENNKIIVDDKNQTNIKGLYAIGDCIGGILQISKAVYEGTNAAMDIIKNKN